MSDIEPGQNPLQETGMIRTFRLSDTAAVLDITIRAFADVSIDRNIEERFGPIHGVGWQERKARHIEADIAANAEGIFVFEAEGGQVAGFVTARADLETRIGSIPNLAVDPDHQGRGIGRQLIDCALAYLRSAGMLYARIETLEQNARCTGFYPRLGFEEIARQIHYIMPLDGPAT